MRFDRYPEKDAVYTWEKDAITFSITRHPRLGHYCGYCRFSKRPVRETGYGGIVTYVPVHGGVTYAEQDEDGSMVYGFDCAHIDSPATPSMEWLTEQCEGMAKALKSAKLFEKRYLRCVSQKGKAQAIDDFLADIGASTKNINGNLGALINLLSGDL